MKLPPPTPAVDIGIYSWGAQSGQYPRTGPAGISYFAGDVSRQHPGKPPIDCLLYRGEDGELLGVLNHYPADYPPLERAGNFLVLVKPSARRRGIATLLLDELDTRYGLKAEQQAYSAPGRALVAHWLRSRGVTVDPVPGWREDADVLWAPINLPPTEE